MHSMRSTQARNARSQRAERNAFYTFAKRSPTQLLDNVCHLVALCNMKHGKYDLHKSSANLSVGTSYSWCYKKNNSTKSKTVRLTRAASESTLFSDYANQINLFEKENPPNDKKCKVASDAGKNRVKCRPRNIKPVYMEPFTGNFFYGKPLPGFEDTQKTEEKLTYLPDSDVVTVSEDLTVESLTTANTVVDIPELVRNPLYGCRETDIQILTPEYSTDSSATKDSQLLSNSCTELRKTMDSIDTENVLKTILKDYKMIMKEWNNTVKEHYSTIPHSKKSSTLCTKSHTGSYVRSLNSTLTCKRRQNYSKYCGQNYYKCTYPTQNYKRYQSYESRKTQSLNRNHNFNSKTSTLQNLKRLFRRDSGSLTPSECECLESIYEEYDKRLQHWCDVISQYSTNTNSVFAYSLVDNLSRYHNLFIAF